MGDDQHRKGAQDEPRELGNVRSLTRAAREQRTREQHRERRAHHHDERAGELPGPDREPGKRTREVEAQPSLGRLGSDHGRADGASDHNGEVQRDRPGHQGPNLGRVLPLEQQGGGEREQTGGEPRGEHLPAADDLKTSDFECAVHDVASFAIPTSSTKISSSVMTSSSLSCARSSAGVRPP